MYVCINIRIRCVLWRFSCNEVEIKAWLGAKNRGYRKNRHLRTYIYSTQGTLPRPEERELYIIYIEREGEGEREKERELHNLFSTLLFLPSVYVCVRESFLRIPPIFDEERERYKTQTVSHVL